MTRFIVPDMTCGGCVKAITAAVKAADPSAEVHTDLATHEVRVSGGMAEAAVRTAIEDAGFTPKPLAA